MTSGTPAPGSQQLRGGMDISENDDILGKLYDGGMIKRLFGFMSEVKGHLIIGALGVLLRTASNLVTPLIVAMAINRILDGDFDGLTIASLIYLGVLLLIWFAQYLETLHLSYTAQGILMKMRVRMFSHLHELSMSFFDTNKIGKIMSRVQNDVEQLQMLVSQDFIMIGVNSITLIGIVAIMITLNWQLALLSLSTLPVLVIIVIIWQRRARKAFVLARRAIAMVNDNLQESISGVRVTQNLSRENRNVKKFDEINQANLEANKKAAFLQGMINPLTQILTDGSYVIVLIFGGFQVLDGTMQAGFLLAFLLYIQRVGQPIQQLATMYTEIQRAMASGARIFELIDVKPEIKDAPDAVTVDTAQGEIEFKNVSFSYQPGRVILDDISFKINKGETVAVVGKTGAGKSSIAGLINRFYEADKGEILLDGTSIVTIAQDSLRRQTGFIPQDPFLFSGTVEDNLRDGRLDAGHDEIVEAARSVGAHEIILHMENGYETSVGERGANLSPGQRQLICLTRAVLADPPILILDEATSNIDTDTERIIQKSLETVTRGRTCIIIAHRLSTVKEVDRIIVLENGRIIETGTHRELLVKKGLYSTMFEAMNRTRAEEP